MTQLYSIYLEIGKKKVFAVSVDWPGWFAHGRDAEAAIQGLVEAGPGYARIVQAAGLAFDPPPDAGALEIIAQVEGSYTTDFGAPDVQIPGDDEPVADDILQHFQAVLEACWEAFDRAVDSARGVELRKGPRGGGRELDGIVGHVIGAERNYLRTLGWRVELNEDDDIDRQLAVLRQGMRDGLAEAAAGNLPKEGPRGGKRWPARYYVRRSGYHITDHIWEIEDRQD